MNERVLRAILRLSLDHSRAVLVCWAMLLLVISPFVLNLEISTSTDSVLNRGTPSWSFYQSSLARFGGDEVLVVALEGKAPFDRALLADLVELTRALEALPGVRRVDSLATVPLVRVSPSGILDLTPPLAGGVPASDDALNSLRAQLRIDRIARGALLSRDEQVAALNVQLESDLGIDFDEVVEGVRGVVEGRGAWISGVPVFRAEINRRAGREVAQFVLATIVVVSAILFFFLRSLVAVALALGVGGVGTWVVLAALGATGTPLTLITVILPSLMLALGCAYSMHVIGAARGAMSIGDLRLALERVLVPTALSGLTTAIGFVAVAAVRIDAIRQVGGFGALGVLSVTFATLSAVPAVLAVRPVKGQQSGVEADVVTWTVGALQHCAVKYSGLVVTGSALGVAVFILGLFRVTIETDVTRWFPRGSDVRDSYEAIRSTLSGISPVNVVIESPNGLVTEPDVLKAIDDLEAYLDGMPEVGKALSVASPLRQIHAGFSEDGVGSLPRSSELVEQYLLLLGSLEYLDDLIVRDRTAANVMLRVDNNGSKHLLKVADRAESWWQAHGPPGTFARATGIMYEFALAEDEIALGQVRGLAAALATIFLIMRAIFRSTRLAAVAMLPNVLPLIVAFGFLGYVRVPLDAGIVVSACMVLGIAVDNTLHMMTSFQNYRQAGWASEASLKAAFGHVLVPVVLSSVAIGLGFAVLGLSGFAFVRNLGLLVVSVMGICLLADVLLLPALLLRYGQVRAKP